MTQAETEQRAIDSLREAVELWFESCISRNVLDDALIEAGFNRLQPGDVHGQRAWPAGLPQAEAARRLGVNQPKVSALANYRLEGFSVERLMHFLNALGRDVEIVIRSKPRSRRAARTFITAA